MNHGHGQSSLVVTQPSTSHNPLYVQCLRVLLCQVFWYCRPSWLIFVAADIKIAWFRSDQRLRLRVLITWTVLETFSILQLLFRPCSLFLQCHTDRACDWLIDWQWYPTFKLHLKTYLMYQSVSFYQWWTSKRVISGQSLNTGFLICASAAPPVFSFFNSTKQNFICKEHIILIFSYVLWVIFCVVCEFSNQSNERLGRSLVYGIVNSIVQVFIHYLYVMHMPKIYQDTLTVYFVECQGLIIIFIDTKLWKTIADPTTHTVYSQ